METVQISRRAKLRIGDPSILTDPTSDLDGFEFKDLFWNPEDLIALMEDSHDAYKCVSEIQPFGLHFGNTVSQTIRRIGTPSIAFTNKDCGQKHLCLLYKRKVQGINLCSQLHFIHDRLFMVADHIERSKDQAETILTILTGKHNFTYTPMDTYDSSNQLIIDGNTNRMVIKMNSMLTLVFFSPYQYTLNAPTNGLRF